MMNDLTAFDASMTFKVGDEKEIGDQGLKKKLLKEGEGQDSPDNGDEVEVDYTGTLLDGTQFDSSRDRETPFKSTLGQGQVIRGWDQGIKTMKKGENALFTIPAELAYGESGLPPTIPPNATLQFDVQLLSWLNTSEKIETAGKMKEEGNAYFKASKYLEAANCYEKAAKLIEHDTNFSEEEKKQTKALKVACYMNDALCKLKLSELNDDYTKVPKLCSKVLEIESTNVKALYRRAKAYVYLAEFDLAERDLKRALEIDPGNRNVKDEFRVLNIARMTLGVGEIVSPGITRCFDVLKEEAHK
ncbi:peptidyl-prolyl cis-trans isomerase FKBP62-like [Rutidosis leptorrhynchoides]|uniref:peptidyl-prolyl cis-trans isomerase FKBP62-like n=1 Tax=Rutidosis leptorrhynchoides TaxID=125765 RepID=UPI003A99F2B6